MTKLLNLQESKDSLAREISTGIYNLIKAVKIYDDDEEEEEEEETDNMASNIIHVQRKLAATERFFIGSELDKHLREIDQNSRAVAHVSRPHYKTKITGLCDEVGSSNAFIVVRLALCANFMLLF